MKLLLALLLLTSCGTEAKQSATYKDGDISIKGPYYGRNGACKIYFGHRIGGDFRGLADNEVSNIPRIIHLQEHECFKRWEFDVRNTKDDKLVVFHDSTFRGRRVEKISNKELKAPLFTDVLSKFGDYPITKPIVVNVKHFKNEDQANAVLTEMLRHGVAYNQKMHISLSCGHKGDALYDNMVAQAESFGMTVHWIQCKRPRECKCRY